LGLPGIVYTYRSKVYTKRDNGIESEKLKIYGPLGIKNFLKSIFYFTSNDYDLDHFVKFIEIPHLNKNPDDSYTL
jgi:hypothetical protein